MTFNPYTITWESVTLKDDFSTSLSFQQTVPPKQAAKGDTKSLLGASNATTKKAAGSGATKKTTTTSSSLSVKKSPTDKKPCSTSKKPGATSKKPGTTGKKSGAGKKTGAPGEKEALKMPTVAVGLSLDQMEEARGVVKGVGKLYLDLD